MFQFSLLNLHQKNSIFYKSATINLIEQKSNTLIYVVSIEICLARGYIVIFVTCLMSKSWQVKDTFSSMLSKWNKLKNAWSQNSSQTFTFIWRMRMKTNIAQYIRKPWYCGTLIVHHKRGICSQSLQSNTCSISKAIESNGGHAVLLAYASEVAIAESNHKIALLWKS